MLRADSSLIQGRVATFLSQGEGGVALGHFPALAFGLQPQDIMFPLA